MPRYFPGGETCLQVFFASTLITPGLAQWHCSWPNRMWVPCDSPAKADPHQARTAPLLIQLLGISWWGRQEQHGNHFPHSPCKNLHLMWWGFFFCWSVLFFSSLLVLFASVIQRHLPALPNADSCVKCSLHWCAVPKRHGSLDDKSGAEGGFYGLRKSHGKGRILAAMERWFYFLLISGESSKAKFLFWTCLSLPNVRFWFKMTCFVPLFMFTL